MIVRVPGAVSPPMSTAAHRLVPGRPDVYRVPTPADRPTRHRATPRPSPLHRLLHALRAPNWA